MGGELGSTQVDVVVVAWVSTQVAIAVVGWGLLRVELCGGWCLLK